MAREESDRPVSTLDQPAPAASRTAAAHRVRALRRRQPGGRAGGHARARCSSAASSPTSSSGRSAGACNGVGHRGHAEPRRGRAARGAPGRRCAATRCSRAGGCRGRGTCSPATTTSSPTRASATSSCEGDTPDDVRPSSSMPLRVVACRPRHRRGGGVRRGSAAARPAGQRRPPGDLSRRSATTAAPWSTARSSTPCPCGTRLSGPVDRIYVMNVAGDLLDRPLRSPIDVAIRAFAISRKQRFELEVRNVPETRRAGACCRRPVDERELFDFSGGEALMSRPTSSPTQALDDADAARRQRRQLRRSWWRRDAGEPIRRSTASRGYPARGVSLLASNVGVAALTSGRVASADPGDDVGEERGVLGPVRRTPRARCRARGSRRR